VPRDGTANISAVEPPTCSAGVEPKAGLHFPKATARPLLPEFADYLLDIAANYLEADTIHL
jgi:hypothetical protein